MSGQRESQFIAVCPDDLGQLGLSSKGPKCSVCGRDFALTDGVVDLLPRKVQDSSSSEKLLLDAYHGRFSRRSEKTWHQPLREMVSRLGNAYLYAWAAHTLEVFAKQRPLCILDAACGDGILRQYLSHRHRYVGIDFSIRPLLRAQCYNPATYFRADLGYLPFPDASFDAVVSLQAIQYLSDPTNALSQIARVLRPGGRLFLSAPNADSFKYRVQETLKIQLQRFGKTELPKLLGRDFDVLEIRTQGLWLPFPKISIHLPIRGRGTRGLSWTVVATPRK